MGGTFKGYTLRHDELFTIQLGQIAAIRQIDRAILAVEWAVCNQPEKYPIIPTTERLRVIKTDPYNEGIVSIPPLKIWFSIEDKGIVLLRSVEVIEDWDTPDAF